MHKAVTGRVEAKKLLSRQRQSNYRDTLHVISFNLKKEKKNWHQTCESLNVTCYQKMNIYKFASLFTEI